MRSSLEECGREASKECVFAGMYEAKIGDIEGRKVHLRSLHVNLPNDPVAFVPCQVAEPGGIERNE